MGNNGNKQERVLPPTGFRVISITKNHVANHMDLITDYIISPDPRKIDLKRESIRFEVYSVLSEQIRTVQLPVINHELGLQLKMQDINSCIFRITKIFPGSPLQKHNVSTGEFIVGMLEGNYKCIKTFAQIVTSVTMLAPKSCVSLGVCGSSGKTRIIKIPVTDLKNWQSKGKGLLGCELGEGWIHKWKPSKKEEQQKNRGKQTEEEIKISQNIEIPKIEESQPQEGESSSSEQIDRKCDLLEAYVNGGPQIDIKFKGILRNEEVVDASSICRCRPVDKECQKCFSQKDGNYYFFNKKTHSIVATPMKMMLAAE